jgi:ABC-type multidrug transport system permease subunit
LLCLSPFGVIVAAITAIAAIAAVDAAVVVIT